MKFLNKSLGIVEETENPFNIEQYKLSDNYQELEDQKDNIEGDRKEKKRK